MAAVMMGGADGKNGDNPVFHDFLGMSCGEAPPAFWAKVGAGRAVETGEASVSVSASAASTGGVSSGGGHGLVSGSSDLGSGPDGNIRLLGRKRSNSDSAFMGLLREKVLPMASDSPESSRMLKAAADEGSRTGIKGSGILNVISSGGGSAERKSAGTLPPNNRTAVTPQIAEPESSNVLGHRGITTTSRQMTIFYAGQAHVFDDVNPKKADVIMALAGSDGGSWSTTYASKSTIRPPGSEGKPPGVEKEMAINNVPFPQDLNRGLSIQGNSSRGGFNQALRLPVLGDRYNLTSGGRDDFRVMGPTKAAEAETEPRRDML